MKKRTMLFFVLIFVNSVVFAQQKLIYSSMKVIEEASDTLGTYVVLESTNNIWKVKEFTVAEGVPIEYKILESKYDKKNNEIIFVRAADEQSDQITGKIRILNKGIALQSFSEGRWTYIPLEKGGLTLKDGEAIVIGDNVNLREKASTSSKVLGSLNKSTILKSIETVEKWVKVNYKGKMGFVSVDFIAEKE